jgi:cell division septation protein DedD
MIDIAAHIGRMVKEHELVVVPGLGGFLTHFHASSIHAVSHKIVPPARHIAFNSQLKDNDGFLANSLAGKMNISYKDALSLILTFSEFCIEEFKEGGKVSFENLGILSMTPNGHIEFSADLKVNYDDHFFGLPPIMAMPIQRRQKHEPVISIHPETKRRIKSQAPLYRKIAAIALPLLMLSFFAWMSKDHIKSYYQQSASVVSLDSNKQEKAAEIYTPEESLPVQMEKTKEPIAEESLAIESEIIVKENHPKIKGSYHIICGAFSEKDRADRLLSQLKAEGFDSYYAGQNNIGLYRISAGNFNSRAAAVEQLRWYQSTKNKDAWLLVLDL